MSKKIPKGVRQSPILGPADETVESSPSQKCEIWQRKAVDTL